MSNDSNTPNGKNFEQNLTDLMNQTSGLSKDEQGNVQKLLQETLIRRKRMNKTIVELKESLDHLRLSVKYLVFDLEATRRENAQLKEQLENRDNPEPQNPGPNDNSPSP